MVIKAVVPAILYKVCPVKLFIKVLFFSLLTPLLYASTTEALKKASLSNVNALIILTSQDMMTSGRYTFASDGSTDDTVMRVYNFPGYYHFDPFVKYLNFFVNGSVGYSRLDSKVTLNPNLPQDDMSYQAVALRAGGGLRYDSGLDIIILGGFDFIYSYIQNDYTYNSAESRKSLQPAFDKAFANQQSNAYTYELFFKIGYFPDWKGWKPYIEWGNNYFDTKTELDTASLFSFRSTSLGSTLQLGFESPQFINFWKTGLSAEYFIAANAFAGDIRETLGFDGYGSTAVLLHLYLHKDFFGEVDETLSHLPSKVNRINFMIEEVKGEGMQGYNVGLSAGFNF